MSRSRPSRSRVGSHLRSAAQQGQHAASGLAFDAADDEEGAAVDVVVAPADWERESSKSRSVSRHSLTASPRAGASAPPPLSSPSSTAAFASSAPEAEEAPSLRGGGGGPATTAVGFSARSRRGGGGGGAHPSSSHALSLSDPSASVALLDDEASSLLSPSASSVQAEGRLNALIFPSSAYSASKSPVRSFYESQNEFISSLKKLVVLQGSDDDESDEKPSTAAYLAIQISLALTFVLLGLKLFTAIYSGSIAVVASAVDSALDVLSQGTLLLISRQMKRYDPYNYPAGKNRMEPVAVLLFSVIMGMAALFLLYESVSDLSSGLADGGKRVKMDAVTVTILVVVVAIQLLMWGYCRRVAALKIAGASSADALAQDHINDVFINIIGGVPAIIAGFVPSAWIADPVGGICLSIYIAVRWTLTAWEQVPAMTGKTAEPSFLNQLTYLAGTHDPRILKVDTILAYHVGLKYQCEVHIVLSEAMSLREAHDIGESLEQKIERLDWVEMAFVHLDYEFTHQPEHAARAKAAGKEVRGRASVDPTAVAAPSEQSLALQPPMADVHEAATAEPLTSSALQSPANSVGSTGATDTAAPLQQPLSHSSHFTTHSSSSSTLLSTRASQPTFSALST